MPGKAKERKGGLTRLDPKVAEWQQKAATNEASLTKRQRNDRARVRVRLDVPEALAEGLRREADAWETSQTQLGAFLLAWGLYRLHCGDEGLTEALTAARAWSKAINVKYDVVIPESVMSNE